MDLASYGAVIGWAPPALVETPSPTVVPLMRGDVQGSL